MSKTIIFIRHAKSSWIDLSQKDFDRPLDERGLSDGPVMAAKLKSLGYTPDILISSSAMRAKTTAQFFGTEYNVKPFLYDSLYHAEPNAYIDRIEELGEEIKCCALVGHNPGMTYIANLIQDGSTHDLPTCSIIIAKAKDDVLWSEMSWEDMQLVDILTPKKVHY